jgi:hypothetical protein
VEKILSGKLLGGVWTTEKVRSTERMPKNVLNVYLKYLRPQENNYGTLLNILLNILWRAEGEIEKRESISI